MAGCAGAAGRAGDSTIEGRARAETSGERRWAAAGNRRDRGCRAGDASGHPAQQGEVDGEQDAAAALHGELWRHVRAHSCFFSMPPTYPIDGLPCRSSELCGSCSSVAIRRTAATPFPTNEHLSVHPTDCSSLSQILHSQRAIWGPCH
eukprot:3567903-Rhodomonas_salina.1